MEVEQIEAEPSNVQKTKINNKNATYLYRKTKNNNAENIKKGYNFM